MSGLKNIKLNSESESIELPLGELTVFEFFHSLCKNFADLMSELTGQQLTSKKKLVVENSEKSYSIIDGCTPPHCPFEQTKSFRYEEGDNYVRCSIDGSYWNEASPGSLTFRFAMVIDKQTAYKIDFEPDNDGLERIKLTSRISDYKSLMGDARFIKRIIKKRTSRKRKVVLEFKKPEVDSKSLVSCFRNNLTNILGYFNVSPKELQIVEDDFLNLPSMDHNSHYHQGFEVLYTDYKIECLVTKTMRGISDVSSQEFKFIVKNSDEELICDIRSHSKSAFFEKLSFESPLLDNSELKSVSTYLDVVLNLPKKD
ncbi:MAG: hypothetical protein ACI857_001572 [Arenicella sp.]|jgi:hypothetical protein